MNSKLVLTAIVLPILAVAIAVATTSVFTPPPLPDSHAVLSGADRIHLAGAVGPESLAFDPSGGGPYTGVADGRILKWDGGAWAEFAFTSSQRDSCTQPFNPSTEHVCGRPLGLRFHNKTGQLYVADAYLGLQVVGSTGGMASPLVTEVDGQRLRFTNDLDIDEHENAVYFTDTSTKFYRR
ncbi:calcium-dependent phosphotriesterase superfamily protein [Striga asiatica]|uniref:Calcium-dependent phosphotriesterase superfamily protein n=1 Tax=Striga asiatica TaxID=4170 RepID=A0A5A7NZ92_STRAF|nr:calcium-dependent phosphotriesterase superfamily protein [Striga asiatica]